MLNKVLVTGSTGFVGQALCNELKKLGIDTVRAARQTESSEYIQVGDINASTNWQNALQGCDTVFHLAARVHVMNDTCDNPLQAYRSVNTEGTLALAKQAALAGVTKFVFVSSIKVLGEEGHFTDTSIPNPIDPYGISKLEAEQALMKLGAETGMSVTIIRPPLVYGRQFSKTVECRAQGNTPATGFGQQQTQPGLCGQFGKRLNCLCAVETRKQ